MGTRTGDIDPAIVPFLMEKTGMTYEEIDRVMNKESGVLGISGVSNDFRVIEEAAANGNKRAQLALNMFHWCLCCCYGRCRCYHLYCWYW